MGRSFLRSSRVRKQSQFQSNGQRAGLHFRTLRVEPLEDRCLLSLGDLLQTLNDPSTAPQVSAHFGYAVAADSSLTVVGTPDVDRTGYADVGAVYIFDSSTGTLLRTLTNPTPAAGDWFGYSVAISGNMVVVGAYADDTGATDAGAAYVFDASTGTLLRTLANPSPTASDWFGWSVAISGNTVVVGAHREDTGATDAGAAYIFDADTGTLLRTLTNPTPAVGDFFGYAVAISGSTVVVGAYADDTGAIDSGVAYVFDAGTGTLLQTLVNPTPASGDNFATTMAISGGTVVIGTYADDTGVTNAGSAYLFDATTGALLHTLANPTPAVDDYFGWGVAISGSTVVIGNNDDDTGATDSGVAYLFDAATGTLLRTLVNPTPAAGDHFGRSVAISGSTVVVGAHLDDTGVTDAGAAYIFTVSTGALLSTLANPTTATADWFGYSAAISGSTAVVGANRDDTGATDSGLVYLFDATTGQLLRTLANPTPAASDQFGISVAISGSTVVVGAYADDTDATDAGSAYVFDANTGGLLWTLANPTPAAGDLFGNSVAISGSTVVVGARYGDAGVTDAGSAYVFDATTGTLLRTLANPTPAAGDWFGYHVAISGSTMVVGASYDDTGATDAGAAYVFDATTGTLLRTLTNPNPATGDQFGDSVAISGGTVVVGAYLDDTGATDSGSAYVFDATTGNLLRTLANPTPAASDYFGSCAAISGSTVVIGTRYDDTGATDSGSAYVFDAMTGSLLRTLANPTPATDDRFGLIVAIWGRATVVSAPYEDGSSIDRGAAYVFDTGRAPTDSSLSSASIAENQPAGTTVGTFSTSDPNLPDDSHTYTLVSGEGSADNASFTIDSMGDLLTASTFDFHTKSTYSIRVRSTDQGNLWFEKTFTVTVTQLAGRRVDLVSTALLSSTGNSDSSTPSISGDGRYVAFYSTASNLVSDDTNGARDIFLKDLVSGVTTRVSTSSSAVQGNSSSYTPNISSDGRYVAFFGNASNLVSDDTNGAKDIFVKDLGTGVTTRVSTDSSAVQGDGDSWEPSISGDGRYVAFRSFASNLVSGDTNGYQDVFVKDLVSGVTTRVSTDSSAVQGNGSSDTPSISGDGRYVAFQSYASNLVSDDTNGYQDVFVKDRVSGVTTRVSTDSSAVQGNNWSDNPSISGNGRYVALESSASNLHPWDTTNIVDVFRVSNFSIDTQNPTLAGLSPTDNATDVAVDANLVITFSEDVQKGTGNLLIKKSSDGSTAETIDVTSGLVTIVGSVATIGPAITLAESTDYYVEVAAGAFENLAGNQFAGIGGATAWNFTTRHLLILYVNDDAAGLNNGTSWANAFTDLQRALISAVSGDDIWVAAGKYKPTAGTIRDISFNLKTGVSLYGGFAGTETSRDQRNWTTNVTILSGDIGVAGSAGDNSYHVVYAQNVTGSVVDGFTVTAGQATGSGSFSDGGGMYAFGSAPTLTNVIFSGNMADFQGGGMYNSGGSPTLTNVTFTGNASGLTVTGGGGGLYSDYGSPTLTNVAFSGNSATGGGGGVCNLYGSPTLINTSFSGNASNYPGSGLASYKPDSAIKVTNSVFWGNTGGSSAQIYDGEGSSTVVTYSIVQGGWAGAGNLDVDPLFVDAARGDLRLKAGSPAVDAGTASGAPSFDRDGNPRPFDGDGDGTANFDMGAYESQVVNQPPIAEAGGPYTVSEGHSVALSSTSSYDPDGAIATYEWDFDYDGSTFNVDAIGGSPTLSAVGLRAGDTRTVAVRVTDYARAVGPIDTAMVTVVDLLLPTVTDLAVSDTLLSNSDVGNGTFVATVVYSEPMSSSTAPAITFAPDVTSTLTFAQGTWMDSMHYTATYDVGGTEVALPGVAITVSGAHDIAGNTQVAYTRSAAFSIDTQNPTATINQASSQPDPSNTSPIQFSVVFSEPVIDFTTGDVTLDGTAGATTAAVTDSGDHKTYDVAVSGMTGSGTVIATIAASVAHDAAGNPNVASTSDDNTVTYGPSQ